MYRDKKHTEAEPRWIFLVGRGTIIKISAILAPLTKVTFFQKRWIITNFTTWNLQFQRVSKNFAVIFEIGRAFTKCNAVFFTTRLYLICIMSNLMKTAE